MQEIMKGDCVLALAERKIDLRTDIHPRTVQSVAITSLRRWATTPGAGGTSTPHVKGCYAPWPHNPKGRCWPWGSTEGKAIVQTPLTTAVTYFINNPTVTHPDRVANLEDALCKRGERLYSQKNRACIKFYKASSRGRVSNRAARAGAGTQSRQVIQTGRPLVVVVTAPHRTNPVLFQQCAATVDG
jgi:hypothetical protein